MEKNITELIKKIMNSKNLNIEELNEAIRLHKTIKEDFDRYKHELYLSKTYIISDNDEKAIMYNNLINRIETSIKEKLNQINIYISEEQLDMIIDMLFYDENEANVKDIWSFTDKEIIIIREDDIELSYNLYNAELLEPQEELYAEATSLTGLDYANSDEVFEEFFDEMTNKVKKLKESLNLNEEHNIYFNKSIDDFYFNNISSFKMILTKLPNTVELYNVEEVNGEWIAKKEAFYERFGNIDTSLLIETPSTTKFKNMRKIININASIEKIDLELALEEFKNNAFSVENLIKTYISCFNGNNILLEENKVINTRLKYLTAELLAQKGIEYKKSLEYAEEIFKAIKDYRNNIINAMNGTSKFPENSLVGTVKKLKNPTSK